MSETKSQFWKPLLIGAGVLAIFPILYLIGEYSDPPPNPLPDAKPVPEIQIIPMPYQQASIQRDGVELTRYHFDTAGENGIRRPFLYPIIGPEGRSLTRMGHPHDPVGHSHHNSVWFSHHSLNGESFWSDRGKGRIVHDRIVKYVDGKDGSTIFTLNKWVTDEKLHLMERRAMTVRSLENGEWLLILDLQLEPPKGKSATFAGTEDKKLSFGIIGVRMAKTIGVKDGGGKIRNSEGAVNEEAVFRKPTKWVDYSGKITSTAIEGITLMDHPKNPNHPASFHVRGDGWMGACLTHKKPITIEEGKTLRLRYGLYVHRGIPSVTDLNKRWDTFAKTKVDDLPTNR